MLKTPHPTLALLACALFVAAGCPEGGGPEPGPAEDAGAPDAEAPDTGTRDTGAPDAGARDTGAPDADGGGDPCAPNPCDEAGRTVCAQDQGGFTCSCDPGLEEDPQGACVSPPVCEGEHTEGDIYEPNECVALATPIASGEEQDHTLEPAGDVDVFALSAAAGEVLRFEVGAGTHALLDADAQPIHQDDRAEWTWTFASAGTYYLEVSGDGAQEAAYTIRVTSLGVDDHGGDAATSTPIPLEQTSQGAIEAPGDVDAFSLDVPQGAILEFEQLVAGSTVTVYPDLLDGAGQIMPFVATPFMSSSLGDRWVWKGVAAGTYTLEVTNPELVGDYGFRVSVFAIDDHADEADGATPTAIGPAAFAGTLQYEEDDDFFTIDLVEDHVMLLEQPVAGQVGLELLDTDGVTRLDGGAAVSYIWKIQATGTYFVRARQSAEGASTYSVDITDLGVDDHGDSLADSTPIALNTDVSAEFEFDGDEDWFSFRTTTAGTYAIDLTSQENHRVTLRDANGTQRRFSATGSTSAPLPANTTYYIEAGGRFSDAMPYTLRVSGPQ
jgi:hypothetical protein